MGVIPYTCHQTLICLGFHEGLSLRQQESGCEQMLRGFPGLLKLPVTLAWATSQSQNAS